jgi:hypothetical protein
MSQPDVDAFVTSLWHERQSGRSLARRAYTAYFIAANRDAIEQYIDGRIAASGASLETFKWAKKTRRMVRQRARGPKGYHFDPRSGSLVGAYQDLPYTSFKIYRRKGQSLEEYRSYRLLRIAGMFFVIMILSGLAFLGWKLYTVAGGLFKAWSLLIEQYTNLY